MLNRKIELKSDKKPRGGKSKNAAGAELTANELDGTGINPCCMQISHGDAINLTSGNGSSLSRSGSDLAS